MKASYKASINHIVKGITDWSFSEKGFKPKGALGRAYVLGKSSAKLPKSLATEILDWQKEQLSSSKKAVVKLATETGPVWVLRVYPQDDKFMTPGLESSDYSVARDVMGSVYESIVAECSALEIKTVSVSDDSLAGLIAGGEMAAYKFLDSVEGKAPRLKILLELNKTQQKKANVSAALALGQGTNLARHLVNLPPGDLHPESFSKIVKQRFSTSKSCKVEVWNQERLKKENMGLLLGVGQGAKVAPCLVRLKYRPAGTANKKPIAFVGKGITFDSGGLDIKPSSGMRWMKKDMGGAAALMGLAHWVESSNLKQACDFYFSLAENSVSRDSFRPGDVLTSRKGLTVEIQNTDAEGRLALSDALDVAGSQKDKPRCIVDVATLTGAIKVGLGVYSAGLFSNDTRLSEQIKKSSQKAGDTFWPMPLDRRLRPMLNSQFADITNSANGFGGAIRAALFLEEFIPEKTPWAHMDIYAWTDKASGALREAGGNGQGVQCLARFLKEQK